MAGGASRTNNPTTILASESDVPAPEIEAIEDEEVPTEAEILPHPGRPWNDFHSPVGEEPEPALSVMTEAETAELIEK